MKTDNELALVSLRSGVMQKLGIPAAPVRPPPEESPSNGSIENAVRQVKDMVRVYLLALKDRLNGEIPADHPIMAWLVEHVGDNLTKYMVGCDGKTPLQRLMGKPLREEAHEFGEQTVLSNSIELLRTA